MGGADAEALAPCRRQAFHIPGCRRAAVDKLQPGSLVGSQIAELVGQQQLQLAGVLEHCRDATHGGRLGLDEGAQQRAPRKSHGHQVCAPGEDAGQPFGRLDEENRVARRATAPRGMLHRPLIGIDAHDERDRLTPGAPQHCLSGTGTQIDDHALVVSDQLVDLTDVHL